MANKSKSTKITYDTFQDMKTWQEAQKLAVSVYSNLQLDNKNDDLISALRRTVLLVTTNTARGFHKRSFEQKITYYYSVQDSLTAFDNALLLARDLTCVTKKTFGELTEQANTVRKMTFGVIKKLKEVVAESDDGE
ncbi:four helix bundle protein [Candidatus Dojkabacteria bacterium]|uniref:Four helix bundle protein n=1 Tax=Candidatus Dojkabacteria bacterium TaxID=2099670 RepID=A0A955L6U0_9BACT|nr:four helix bundle protein [Candidatus Dojkabacteria bacterium]